MNYHKTTLRQVLFVVLEKNALKTSKIFSIQIFGHTEVVESSQTKTAKVGTRSLSKLIDLCQEIHRKLFSSSLGNFRKPTFRPIDFESVSVSTKPKDSSSIELKVTSGLWELC